MSVPPAAPPAAAPFVPSLRLRWIAWATVALYVLLAVCLTHMPRPPTELVNEFKDKTLHTAGYFVYASVLYVAAGLTFPRLRGLPVLVVLFLAVWAALDEITQPYFGRTCDLLDWRADMVGALAAVVVLGGLRFAAAVVGRRHAKTAGP